MSTLASSPARPLDRGIVWVLVALALSHFALAMAYASQTPYREAGILRLQGGATANDIGAPDERQHANYVQHLLDGKGFPVFNPQDPELYESYQSHQPPLYYVLAAGWARVVGVQDVSGEGAGPRLRSFSAVLGALTVVGVFFFAWWAGYGRLGLFAAALAAWLPMLCALDGAVGNDALLISLCTWGLAVTALGARYGWTFRRCVVLAVLVGAGFLTKTSSLALAVPLLVLMGARLDSRNPRALLAVLAGAALLAAPWWLRNQQLYGDPLALRAFGNAFGGTAQAKDFIAEVGPLSYWLDWVGWWTGRSFIGAFGYMDIFLPDTLYRLWLALFVAGFGGWLLFLRTDEDTVRPTLQWVFLAFTGAVVLLFVRFNAQYFQGQGRYLMHAIAPFAVGIMIGISKLALGSPDAERTDSRKRIAWVTSLVLLAMMGTNLYALSRLGPEFERRVSSVQRAAWPQEA